MALIPDIYTIPQSKWEDIKEHCDYTLQGIDEFFQKEYYASKIDGTWDQWQYMFRDLESYTEFILKWM